MVERERKALAAADAEGSASSDGVAKVERVYEAPVKRPRDTVPTNFRTETFLDAIVSDKRGELDG